MLSSGTRLGGVFEILGPLGAGAMGEVYRARDAKLGREVAIKVLPRDLAGDADRLTRFEHEARAASALNHPNIVTLYDVGRDGDAAFQVLELVQGRNLRDLVARGGIPWRQALQLAEQIAAGLAAAHASGIVHRDLKPENVMVRDDGLVKILDFGLAKQLQAHAAGTHLATSTQFTSPGAVLGTVGYMAPEQARGEPVDFRADQFSLGAMLYEMSTGVRPFAGDSAAQTLTAIIEKEPEPVSRLRPDAPRPLLWILDRCLAKDPRDRYASTLDLARDLRNVREHLSEMSAESRPGEAAKARRAGRLRRGLPAGLLGAGLGLAAGIGLTTLLGDRGGRDLAAPPRLRTITFSGQDYQPAASRDGRTLAFVSSRDGHPRIWLKSLAEGSEAALTSGPDHGPRFSPDGSMLLFARDEREATSLYRVATLGGEPRKLVHDASDGDWAPGGDQVVFLRTGTRDATLVTSVGVARSDGGGERVIATVEDAALAYPRWSPDGAWIAISAGQFGASESFGKYILLMRTDGSQQHKLSPPEEGGDVTGVAWLGAGREILYIQGESVTTVSLSATVINAGASRFWRQDITSGAARVVLWTPTLSTMVDVVAAGHIVFDAVMPRQALQEFDLESGVGVRGATLSQGTSVDRQPIYTPDGEWVAFSSNRSGNLDIWARSTRTSELRQLTDHPADDWDPAFTADNRQLIWTSRRGGNFEIWMANADGTGARQVTHDGVDAENATATPDGQWLVYNSANPAKMGIWKIRTDGTEATHLVQGTTAWPEVSPDGRYASYAMSLSTSMVVVRVVRIADGENVPFEIRIVGGVGSGGRSRWLPGGGAIAFNANEHDNRGIFAQDFRPGVDTSGSRRLLVRPEAGIAAETFGIAPDGKRLTLAMSDREFNLMSADGMADLEPGGRRAP